MKKEIIQFILSILDKTYKFLAKLRCSCCCCNSNCTIDKSLHVAAESIGEEAENEIRKNKSESSLDSLKNK